MSCYFFAGVVCFLAVDVVVVVVVVAAVAAATRRTFQLGSCSCTIKGKRNKTFLRTLTELITWPC